MSWENWELVLNLFSGKVKNLKAILAWCFYDWANSAYSCVITTFIFGTYFTEKIATNRIIGTAEWAHADAIAGLLIAIVSPVFGAVADYQGRRKPWILFFNIFAFISAMLLWFAMPSSQMVFYVLTCFIIGTFCLEVAFVFYNSMLSDIAPSAYLGRISGWAWGLGYLGGIISLVIALLLVRNTFSWLPLNPATYENVRITGPLVALWLAIFTPPLFIFVPDRKPTGLSFYQAIITGITSLWTLLIRMSEHKKIFLFLLARMIYTDGLNTLFAFAGIYAAGTMGMSLTQVIELGIVLNISAGIGAAIFAWVDDLKGSKYTVLLTLTLMIIFGICLVMTSNLQLFWFFAIGVSLSVGPVQAASRTYMVRVSPPEIMTELFGLYALSGKATAFIGPWVLGWVTLQFNSQRAGVASVFVFLALGGILLTQVKD